MNIIAIVEKNWGIGAGGKQPYFIKEDLEFFKKKTLNQIVVMGKNTLMALPKQKPLKHRQNIVISKTAKNIQNTIIFNNIPDCLKYLSRFKSKDIFIIGGQSIYKQFLKYCHIAYITKIYPTTKNSFINNKAFDKFFPNLDIDKNWKLVKQSALKYDSGFYYSFTEYKQENYEKM